MKMKDRSDKMMGDNVVVVRGRRQRCRLGKGYTFECGFGSKSLAPVRHAAEAQLQADRVDRIPPHSMRPHLSPSASLSQTREASARPRFGLHPKCFIFLF